MDIKYKYISCLATNYDDFDIYIIPNKLFSYETEAKEYNDKVEKIYIFDGYIEITFKNGEKEIIKDTDNRRYNVKKIKEEKAMENIKREEDYYNTYLNFSKLYEIISGYKKSKSIAYSLSYLASGVYTENELEIALNRIKIISISQSIEDLEKLYKKK